MASIYPKARSPFWYVQFTGRDGKRVNRSTGLRKDSPADTAQARVVAARFSAAELHHAAEVTGWGFVAKFLEDHCSTAATLVPYRNRWAWISLYLADAKLRSPRDVRFEHGQGYIDWRTAYQKKSGSRSVCRNTAIIETKLFSMIMQRAVRLDLCHANPLVRLGLRKDDPDEKPEITDAEFAILLPALDREPKWMRDAFLISMHTGCRLRETIIPARGIDLDAESITFFSPKGGKRRAFSIPMPPELRPLFETMRREGRQVTLTMPFQPSRQFQHFFRRVKMKHLCFHCLRVSFITRLARASVPISEAMRRVNHASTLIHRVYQRLNVEDLRGRPLSLYSGIAVRSTDRTGAATPGTSFPGIPVPDTSQGPPRS